MNIGGDFDLSALRLDGNGLEQESQKPGGFDEGHVDTNECVTMLL